MIHCENQETFWIELFQINPLEKRDAIYSKYILSSFYMGKFIVQQQVYTWLFDFSHKSYRFAALALYLWSFAELSAFSLIQINCFIAFHIWEKDKTKELVAITV